MDVQGTWENYGFFLRPTAFYDFVYADNDLEFRNLESGAKDQLDYDVDILDAFVYGNWDIDGHFTTVRLGKQVLNWGESLFIQGGVNAFQALDVTRIRTPGAELKDALTPMPMIFASTTITPNFSVEAFWQFAYEYTELDPSGSFFSNDDITGRGSLPALLNAIIDNPDLAFPPGTFPPNPLVPIAVQRTKDRIASETDQFGVALRYYAEELGDGVDFGLYAVRYTSRLPVSRIHDGTGRSHQCVRRCAGSHSRARLRCSRRSSQQCGIRLCSGSVEVLLQLPHHRNAWRELRNHGQRHCRLRRTHLLARHALRRVGSRAERLAA